jgi:SAM-dependent methyltransferase
MQNLYGEQFWEGHSTGSRQSADIVAPIIVSMLRPQSVVDVGCGIGTWLASFADSGVPTVLGLDGAYAKKVGLQIPEERFVACDLREPPNVGRTFDLAVSLEVAEHLPPECAEDFVDSLVRLAPAVLFSAAIPGQGGTGHVNERWQSFWAGLFLARGYTAVDCVRPRVWDDPRVSFWYAQNTLLYVDSKRVALEPDTAIRDFPLDIVHPRQYELEMKRNCGDAPRIVRYATQLSGALRHLRNRARSVRQSIVR